MGAYVLGAWVGVAGVDWVTARAGLPSWTPRMALVLAVALFPLVVATTLVQGGLPGLRIEDEVDPNELEGLTPEQVHVVPEAHPLYRFRLFTWRNTLLGGVAAVTLLLASVVAYLTMWALGIGPVGSLLAQGVISRGDPVAVTSFVNLTDDASLGAVVSDALELDLTESDVVSVTPGGPTSAGETLLVDGEVAPIADGYLISARIVLAREATTLARFEEATSDEDDLLDTIELLSERIRERLGESLRSVRGGPRLPAVRSESLEALRMLALAHQATHRGDQGSALELLEEAVRLDDRFALAWRKLGAVREQRADTTGALEAYARVVELWSETAGGQRTVRALRDRILALQR